MLKEREVISFHLIEAYLSCKSELDAALHLSNIAGATCHNYCGTADPCILLSVVNIHPNKPYLLQL
jgi:hypothetical protein